MGRLPPGTPLPSERGLSVHAGVSRTTVGGAIDALVAAGWAERRNRSRAVARLPDARTQALAPGALPVPMLLEHVGARMAAPAELVTEAIDRARIRLTPYLLGDGRDPSGVGELRALVAERLSVEELGTHPDQVLVTNGAMGGLSALLDHSAGAVVVEDPTYHQALRLVSARRRKLLPWTRGRTWDCAELAELARRSRPALTYVVPDFHNPTGALVGLPERRSFAGLSNELGTVVIDETLRDIDLRPAGSAMPPHLAALVPQAVTIGGLGKTVWSGLRVGWMRVPDRNTAARLTRLTDLQPAPLLEQLVAVELWPHLDAVIADRTARLRLQRDVLVNRARFHGMTVHVPDGGLVCWIDLGKSVASVVVERAFARGVAVAPGSLFSASRTYDRFIRVPFTLDCTSLTGVVDALAEELFAISADPR